MILGVPISEFVWLAAAIIVGGVISGFLAGLFGIGGGAIVVPVLFEVFRFLGVPEAVHMQLAIGTSLAIMTPTNIRSYLAHRASGAVLDDIVRQWSLPAVIGTGVGSLIASVAPSSVFKVAFVIVIGIIALKLLLGKDTWRIADDLPQHPLVRGYGFLVGLSAALTGVSGGSLCTMVLMLYGKTIHQGGRDVGGLDRSDHHRGDHRLCARGAAASGAAAAALDRFCFADRVCLDGSGRKSDRVHWGAGCACDVQAAPGDRVRAVPADGGAALPGQPHRRIMIRSGRSGVSARCVLHIRRRLTVAKGR
jgi:hypothetical protein